jgi:hypothetical protein
MMTTVNIKDLPAFAGYPDLTKKEQAAVMRAWRKLLTDPRDGAKATDYVRDASSIYALALDRASAEDFPCWDATRECFRKREYIQLTRDVFRQWRRRSLKASTEEPTAVHQARLKLLDMAIAEADTLLSIESELWDEDTALLHQFDYALNILPCWPYVS